MDKPVKAGRVRCWKGGEGVVMGGRREEGGHLLACAIGPTDKKGMSQSYPIRVHGNVLT